MTVAARAPVPAFHPAYARLVCAALQRQGIEPARLLADTRLQWDRLLASGQALDVGEMRSLIEAALRLSGAPGLGLAIGHAIPVSAHGPVGFALMASKDLRQALEVVARYGALRSPALAFRLLDRDGLARLQVREQADLGAARMPLLEALAAVLRRALEEAVGQALREAAWRFPYPAPAWSGRYTEHFGNDLRFDADCLELQLPHAVLSTPCLTADATAYAAALRDCEQALAETLRDSDVVHQVRQRLRAHGETMPTCAQMAASLHMSQRTLIRKLGHGGTRYQQLVDEVRKDEAQWYLSHTAYSVEAIAARLGFIDTSNFSRCFRRWSGMTPGEFRRTGAPSAPPH